MYTHMDSKSCSDISVDWPSDMPPPVWSCTCPPTETCHKCTPSLWTWKSTPRIRRTPLLVLQEREKSLNHASSEPSFRRINLLEEVTTVIEGPKSAKLWTRAENLINTRAIQLYRIWNDLEDRLSLAEWAGEHFPSDSVAIVWWTDKFFDKKYESHAFDDLVGQDCSLWTVLEDNIPLQ